MKHHKFKVGDKVACIEDSIYESLGNKMVKHPDITEGAIYEIGHITSSGDSHDWVEVLNDKGSRSLVRSTRFVPAPTNSSASATPNNHIGTPNAGIKHDAEKPMLALIPAEALDEEGWVWTFGATKYGKHNWRKGLTYMRILSAMLRHLTALMRGEDVDPESGKLHAAHIRCCAGMLISFQKANRKDLDDRHKAS